MKSKSEPTQTSAKKNQPKPATQQHERQECLDQTRRVMKAYLEAPIETRHIAAREARKAPTIN